VAVPALLLVLLSASVALVPMLVLLAAAVAARRRFTLHSSRACHRRHCREQHQRVVAPLLPLSPAALLSRWRSSSAEGGPCLCGGARPSMTQQARMGAVVTAHTPRMCVAGARLRRHCWEGAPAAVVVVAAAAGLGWWGGATATALQPPPRAPRLVAEAACCRWAAAAAAATWSAGGGQ
jgi:hypothetical protein